MEKNPKMYMELPDLAPNTSLNRYNKTNTLTLKMGKRTPICIFETLPGDHWQGNADIFMRFYPLYAPVMHKVEVITHFFYVPTRILWNYDSEDSFETFLTGGRDGTKVIPPPMFHTSEEDHLQWLTGYSSLADYLGVNVQHITDDPDKFGWNFTFSQLPFRAYQSVCDEFYRNKNLQDSYFNEIRDMHSGGSVDPDFDYETDDGGTIKARHLFTLRDALWEDDYFTSALPSPERGEPINIPFLSSVIQAPLDYISGSRQTFVDPISGNPVSVDDQKFLTTSPANSVLTLRKLDYKFSPAVTDIDFQNQNFDATDFPHTVLPSDTSAVATNLSLNNTHKANLSTVRNSATIRDLRIASLAERFQEISANTLPDYRHLVNAFFDVVVPDYRLQLPELVGGGKQAVTFSEVTQTSQTTEGTGGSPQGNQAGHGVSYLNPGSRRHSFDFVSPEHGFLIGIMTVVPRTSYCQGINRMYKREDRFDYYFPLFESLPFQEVKNEELYASGVPLRDNGTFGYQPRYSDMVWSQFQDEIHGDFKGSLDYWTMARLFQTTPTLNTDFVTSNPTTRIFNVDDEEQENPTDKLYSIVDFNISLYRKMSKYVKV